jgi:uracil-DNA glycosylase family 4
MVMDERRRQYLEAMGIQNWIPRGAPAPSPVVEAVAGSEVLESLDATPDTSGHENPEIPPMPPWLEETPPLTEDLVPGEGDEAFAPEFDSGVVDRGGIGALDWEGLEQRVKACSACDLCTSRTNTVFGVGNRDADLLVLGEAPGVDEDRQGEPFVGRAGQLLNAMLGAISYRREQVYIANILKCRPPGNRDPHHEEALRCEPYLKRQIALISPRAILCVGRVAAQNLLKSEEPVGRMRGRKFHFGDIPVIVTYHPAYLLRSPDQKAKAWQDLQQVAGLLR